MKEVVGASDALAAGLVARPDFGEEMKAPRFFYEVVCVGPDGQEKWREGFWNLVTTAGKTDIIDKYLKGSAYTAAWYLGLKGSGTAAAADTMASHAGWSEVTAYAAATRPAITWGTTSAGSNTASAVSFSINASVTVAGAFTVTDSTKSGTTGTLYSAGDFAAARSAANGDTINVTPTLSAT
jgi:hypothetical protein